MAVHSSEEIARSLLMHVRTCVARARVFPRTEEQRLEYQELLSHARDAFIYLEEIMRPRKMNPRSIGTNLRELRWLDLATKSEHIKTAQELMAEFEDENFK
jgi:hypothetical protein